MSDEPDATKTERDAGRGDGPHLDRVIQAQIGDRLRAMYGELIDQPVPDKLSSILDRLSKGARD